MNKQDIHRFQEKFFDIIMQISLILLIATSLGTSIKAKQYLDDIYYYIRIYVCLFLMWRFNPLRSTYEFTTLNDELFLLLRFHLVHILLPFYFYTHNYITL